LCCTRDIGAPPPPPLLLHRRLLQLCWVPEGAAGCCLPPQLKALLLYLDHGAAHGGERRVAVTVGRASAFADAAQQHRQVGRSWVGGRRMLEGGAGACSPCSIAALQQARQCCS
jgi:hypothetical protein